MAQVRAFVAEREGERERESSVWQRESSVWQREGSVGERERAVCGRETERESSVWQREREREQCVAETQQCVPQRESSVWHIESRRPDVQKGKRARRALPRRFVLFAFPLLLFNFRFFSSFRLKLLCPPQAVKLCAPARREGVQRTAAELDGNNLDAIVYVGLQNDSSQGQNLALKPCCFVCRVRSSAIVRRNAACCVRLGAPRSALLPRSAVGP